MTKRPKNMVPKRKNRKKYIYKKEKKQEQNNYMYCTVKQFMTHKKIFINIEK